MICESPLSAARLQLQSGIHHKTINEVRRANGVDTMAFQKNWIPERKARS
jgi:hypothetical protein